MFSKIQEQKLLHLAREAIKSAFSNKNFSLSNYENFNEKKGVFVTLTINDELRGCIGYIKPISNLNESISKAAKAAAFRDLRFSPLTENELDKIKIEISILTEPKLISVKNYSDYLKKIEIGDDGLLLEYGPNSGLLLPNVATEFNFSIEEFLENLCYKAGLSKFDWKEPGIKIYKFQTTIFKEE